MWNKIFSALIGVLIQKLPQIISSITNAVGDFARRQKEKSKNKKAAKKLAAAKTKEEYDEALDNMP